MENVWEMLATYIHHSKVMQSNAKINKKCVWQLMEACQFPMQKIHTRYLTH